MVLEAPWSTICTIIEGKIEKLVVYVVLQAAAPCEAPNEGGYINWYLVLVLGSAVPHEGR